MTWPLHENMQLMLFYALMSAFMLLLLHSPHRVLEATMVLPGVVPDRRRVGAVVAGGGRRKLEQIHKKEGIESLSQIASQYITYAKQAPKIWL